MSARRSSPVAPSSRIVSRGRRPRPGDTWHLDEVFLRINGAQHYLWRAVDQHGFVLDILMQDCRNAASSKRFFKRLLRGLQHKPRDLLRQRFSYYADDMVVLTWDRAFIYEPRGDSDVIDALEVANAQLLEMRY